MTDSSLQKDSPVSTYRLCWHYYPRIPRMRRYSPHCTHTSAPSWTISKHSPARAPASRYRHTRCPCNTATFRHVSFDSSLQGRTVLPNGFFRTGFRHGLRAIVQHVQGHVHPLQNSHHARGNDTVSAPCCVCFREVLKRSQVPTV